MFVFMPGRAASTARGSVRVLPGARKAPAQERSRQLVRTILDATARLLEERGYAGLTTRHVAERAGVSVGSLYQYFPNKESMVHALFVEHLEQAAALRPAVLARPDLPLDERIRRVVDWFFAAHAASPALHRALTEAAIPVLGVARIRALEHAFHQTVHEALRPYAAEIGREDLALAAFVVAQTLEGLTHSAVVHHPEQLGGERLRREVSDLLLGYLRARPGVGRPP
jgi:AcrR family transcriptional regulator